LAAFLTGPLFFAGFAGNAFVTALLAAAFVLVGADFFAVAACAFAAFANRQRFFVAATIRFMPSSLIRRLDFGGSDVAAETGGPDSPRIFAHRRCWASFIRFRAAEENLLRLRVVGPGVAAVSGPPESMALSSEICWSIRIFCDSKPSMAAVKISFVSLIGIGVSNE
jgi:hypothetical protein